MSRDMNDFDEKKEVLNIIDDWFLTVSFAAMIFTVQSIGVGEIWRICICYGMCEIWEYRGKVRRFNVFLLLHVKNCSWNRFFINDCCICQWFHFLYKIIMPNIILLIFFKWNEYFLLDQKCMKSPYTFLTLKLHLIV